MLKGGSAHLLREAHIDTVAKAATCHIGRRGEPTSSPAALLGTAGMVLGLWLIAAARMFSGDPEAGFRYYSITAIGVTALNPRGRYLASGSKDTGVALWDFAAGWLSAAWHSARCA